MDKTMLRLTALQIADRRIPPGLPNEDLTAEADKIYAWLTQDGPGSDASAVNEQASNPNQPSTTHESEAAVVGQEPKGE